VEIFGYGTVDSSILSRVFIGCSTPLQPGNLRFEKCRRVKVDGPVFLDSPGWCVTCVVCDDVEFARMKVVGQWRYNTDGVDIVNSRHVRLRDSFVRAFDDAVTIKGIPRCIDCPVRDVRVERCVLWCGWGRTCELGIETWAREYRDVVFEDCDLVHNSCTALDLRMGGTATLEHIVFRNLRVEFQAGLPEIFQSSETMTYAPGENRQTAHFIHIENGKFVRPQEPHGNVSDIRFENIDAIVEPGARNPDIVLMSSHGKFGPISFSNLKLNETPVRSLAAFPLHTNEASTANLTFR